MTDAGIPVVELSGALAGDPLARAEAAAAIDAAGRDTGFLSLTGHGIDPALVEAMVASAAAFFSLPRQIKERYLSPSGNPFRGWSAVDAGTDLLREQFEVSRFDRRADLAAAGYGPEWVDGFEENAWPGEVPAMEAGWKRYLVAMDRLGLELLSLMAEALGLPPGWFDDKFSRQSSFLCCNHFPALSERQESLDGVSFTEHTDIGSLTLLYQDDGPGRLQILQRSGSWIDVPHRPGTYVVNLGDLMAKWTNDRWVATRHRVLVADPGGERPRFSVPYFQHPNLDALIECVPTCHPAGEPPRYEPVLAGRWASHRFAHYDDEIGPLPVD